MENKLVSSNTDLQDVIAEAAESLDKHGYYIAKGLIEDGLYNTLREEGMSYFSNKAKKDLQLSYRLRGNVSSGMKDIAGFAKNKVWHIYRTCFFTWNTVNSDISHMINASR